MRSAPTSAHRDRVDRIIPVSDMGEIERRGRTSGSTLPVDGSDASEVSVHAVFVHDFLGIDLPFRTILDVIGSTATTTAIERMVCAAWQAEVQALDESQSRLVLHAAPDLRVAMGSPRRRHDAIVLPVSWRCYSIEWVPPVDADLELAAFGPERTHLHLYGRSELPPGQVPASEEASLSHRLAVAVVRHVLTLFIDDLNTHLGAREPR